MKQIIQSILFLGCFVLMSAAHQTNGCSSSKSEIYGAPRPATDSRSADFLLKKMTKQEQDALPLKSFTAKARIFSQNDDMSLAANANIIWIRDSIVWLNAKKFGIEALRALVTKDSVFVLNRLEKTCTVESLESLRIKYNLPEGDVFTVLQNTLLGLGIFPETRSAKSDISEEKHRILSETNQYTAEYRIEEGSFLLKNELFLQKKDNAAISILFDRHQKIKESTMPFSFSRKVETFSPSSGRQNVEIELEEVLFNTKPAYKFDIPGHYTRQ
jgi:Domain of unknown function (DUF4292)